MEKGIADYGEQAIWVSLCNLKNDYYENYEEILTILWYKNAVPNVLR